MSWEEIDKASVDTGASSKHNAEKRAQAAELAKAYNRCFGSDDGKRVLSDLTARFIHSQTHPTLSLIHISSPRDGLLSRMPSSA